MVIREQTKGVKGCCNPLTPIKNELENVKQIAVTAKSTADQSADLIDDCLQRTAQSEIDIDNLDKSVADLQVDIGDITVDIYNLEERATADEVRIATNESNIVTHAQRLTALESSESEHESEITTLQGDVADIKPRLTTAESDIDSLESTVSTQSTALNDLRDRMNAAESDITEHDGEIATAQDNIAVNASEISGVKTRVSTLEGTIPEAVKQVTVSQDASTVYHDAVHISGTTERDALPVASRSQAGVMSAAVYTAFDDGIKSNTARIETLESGTTVYDITGSVGEFPTIGEITSAFTAKYPAVTLKEGIRAVDYAYAHIWQYGNSTWLALTEVTVALATNDTAGTVKGSSTDGQIYVETDGTMSVNGYDTLITHDQTHDSKITALESKNSSQDTEISGIKSRLTTAESDIDSNTSEITDVKTDISAIKTKNSSQDTEISNIKTDITAIKTKNASQDTEISGVKTRLTTAEGTIAGNSSSISLLQTRIQTAESDIDACEGRLTTNESNIAANASDIADVEERTSTLESDIVTVHTQLAKKQDVLTAGDNISISDSNVISATDTKYTAGDNISISDSNVISATGAGVTAGTGLSLSGSTINHSNSVTAKTSYVGSATAIPRIKYDAQGHITGTSSVTVYPPTATGTKGQLWTSQSSGVGKWRNPSEYDTVNNETYTESYSFSTWYGGWDSPVIVMVKSRDSQNIIIRRTWSNSTSSWFHLMAHWDNNHGDGMASHTFVLPAGCYFYVDLNNTASSGRNYDTTNRFFKYFLTGKLRG